MAQYHFHVQIFSRGQGRSAVGGAAYRSGERIKSEYDGRITNSIAYRSGEEIENLQDGHTFDYTSRRDIVVHSEILLPNNAPREYLNRTTLWNAVELKERRHDAQLAREFDVSLPIEFTLDENAELIREFVQKNFVDKGICADINIHDAGDGNPHAHVMLTMREVSEKGFGNRRAEEQGRGYFERQQRIEQWRSDWANRANRQFEEKGLDIKIDHRTLEAQGIDREPQKYMGINYSNTEARKKAAEKQQTLKKERKQAVIEKQFARAMKEANNELLRINGDLTAGSNVIRQMEQISADNSKRIDFINTKINEINQYQKSYTDLSVKKLDLISENNNTNVFKFIEKANISKEIRNIENEQRTIEKSFRERYNMSIEESNIPINQLKKELDILQAAQRENKVKTANLRDLRKTLAKEFKTQTEKIRKIQEDYSAGKAPQPFDRRTEQADQEKNRVLERLREREREHTIYRGR